MQRNDSVFEAIFVSCIFAKNSRAMQFIETLQKIQNAVSEKINISVFAKRTNPDITDASNIRQLLESNGFSIITAEWETIPTAAIVPFFIQLTTRNITNNDVIFASETGNEQWQTLIASFASNTRFYTNIAGVDAFVNGESYGWIAISDSNFEAAMMLVDDEKLAVFLVTE